MLRKVVSLLLAIWLVQGQTSNLISNNNVQGTAGTTNPFSFTPINPSLNIPNPFPNGNGGVLTCSQDCGWNTI